MSSTKTLGKVASAGMLLLSLVLCGCQGLVNGTSTTPPPPNANLQSINHIVFMVQENRSFDSYFGQLPAYWQANGYPSQALDGTPVGASNPGVDGTPIPAFHIATECTENLTPSWNESHLDWNLQHPNSSTATMDGFAYNAAEFAIHSNEGGANPPYTDTTGERAMGYYDASDLNYYYFMASNFATSDRWFSPVMDRTQVNRMYLFAATSHGYAYPPGTNLQDNAPLNVPTIFDELNTAGVTWKVYATDNTCTSVPTGDSSLAGLQMHANASSSNSGACTYLTQFQAYNSSLPANVVTADQFLTDAKAGALPAVSFIETGYLSNRDEHPSTGTNVQTGAAYVETLINGLMNSPSWKDSVFILTYDEAGGLYDHVPPMTAVNPDDISPVDLQPNDICTTPNGAVDCNFDKTGYRVPLIVVSPFTKKNFVSHTPADYTAVLKLIETRFSVPSLTKRDAAQMDMAEFFDFSAPWATPPSNVPAQATGGVCNATLLP